MIKYNFKIEDYCEMNEECLSFDNLDDIVKNTIEPKTIAFTGSRNFAHSVEAFKFICDLFEALKPKFIVHGGAQGFDNLVGKICQTTTMQEIVFPYVSQLGKAGGCSARNHNMLSFTKPNVLIAFPTTNPMTPGTKNAVETAMNLKIPTIICTRFIDGN